MTLQMANYYKHTRSLSLAALWEKAVAFQCLDSLSAAVTSLDSSAGLHARMRACVSTYNTEEAHSSTCLPPCHIREWLDPSTDGAAGAGDYGEGGSLERCVWQLFVEWQLISVPICHDCFAESLFLLVDFFQQQQIPQQVFLCTCVADEVSTWAWKRK